MFKIYGSATPAAMKQIHALVPGLAQLVAASGENENGMVDFVVTPAATGTRWTLVKMAGVTLHPSVHNPDELDAAHIATHLSHLKLPPAPRAYHAFAAMRDAYGFDFDPDI